MSSGQVELAAAINGASAVWGVRPATGEIVKFDIVSGAELYSFAAPGNLDADHTNIGLSVTADSNKLIYINSDDDPNAVFEINVLTGEVIQFSGSTATVDGLGVTSSNTSVLGQSFEGSFNDGDQVTAIFEDVGVIDELEFHLAANVPFEPVGLVLDFEGIYEIEVDPSENIDECITIPAADIAALTADGTIQVTIDVVSPFGGDIISIELDAIFTHPVVSVSYTHLTLPTKRIV